MEGSELSAFHIRKALSSEVYYSVARILQALYMHLKTDFPSGSWQVRPLRLEDFQHSMKQIRPSVSMELIRTLEQWNTKFGVSS